MKKLLTLALVFSLGAFTIGCGGSSTAPTTPKPAPVDKDKDKPADKDKDKPADKDKKSGGDEKKDK